LTGYSISQVWVGLVRVERYLSSVVDKIAIVTRLGILITRARHPKVRVTREEGLVPLVVGTLSDRLRRSIVLNSPLIANIFHIALNLEGARDPCKFDPYMDPESNVPYPDLE
jgi:hypothetical protein